MSVDISVDIGGILGVDDADLPEDVLRAIRGVLDELVHLWREEMLAIWPVATGRSQSRWQNRMSGLTWILRNPVEYAAYVHRKGDPTEVWGILDGFAKHLLGMVMPRLKRLISAWKQKQRLDANQRRLISLSARRRDLREAPTRMFRADVRVFQRESSLERHRRQLMRFLRG